MVIVDEWWWEWWMVVVWGRDCDGVMMGDGDDDGSGDG